MGTGSTLDGFSEGGISRGCVLTLGFHIKCFAVCSLHLDCFTLLAVTHNYGPFLLILKLDVD